MNYLITTFSIILIWLLPNLNYSQHLEKAGLFKWTDGTNYDKLHRFEHIFQSNENQMKSFRRFNRARKAHKISNYASIGLVGAGTLAAVSSLGSGSSGEITVALIIFAAAPTYFLISNLVIIPIRIPRKKKLLESQFQNPALGNIKSRHQQIDLKLESTTNGIGLVFTF